VTALALAVLTAFAAPSPSPSPSPRAAYYDQLTFPAAVGDHHAELRNALAAVLGEQMVVTQSDVPGTPGYTRATACKTLGVCHLVIVGGGEWSTISSHVGGSKSLAVDAWIWDCRDQRVAASANARSVQYDVADAKTLQTMYAALSASVLERIRKGLAEPPDPPDYP
jgi:hypothetical protein